MDGLPVVTGVDSALFRRKTCEYMTSLTCFNHKSRSCVEYHEPMSLLATKPLQFFPWRNVRRLHPEFYSQCHEDYGKIDTVHVPVDEVSKVVTRESAPFARSSEPSAIGESNSYMSTSPPTNIEIIQTYIYTTKVMDQLKRQK